MFMGIKRVERIIEGRKRVEMMKTSEKASDERGENEWRR